MAAKFKWNWRILVSYFLLFSPFALVLSGIALYIAPPGRVAHTIDWRFLGLTKEQWEAFHTVFGYVSALFVVFHVLLNWRFLVSYLKSRVRLLRIRPELILAVVLAVLVGVGSALNWVPFRNLMDLGERLSASWEASAASPAISSPSPAGDETGSPSGGWGKYTVADICSQAGVPLAEALARLQARGLAATASSRVRDLAEASGLTPEAVLELIKGTDTSH